MPFLVDFFPTRKKAKQIKHGTKVFHTPCFLGLELVGIDLMANYFGEDYLTTLQSSNI